MYYGALSGLPLLKLAVQARGYNEATFRVPDEAGWAPVHEKIDPAEAHAYLETDLPVASLAGALRGAGADVAVSHSAGRFVCNYLLFRSLQRSRAAGPRWHSLFVHLPCVTNEAGARHLLEACASFIEALL